MDANAAFVDLMTQVRAGEATACNRLIETYGDEIRRVIRIRLREPLVQSIVDTSDIYQSVMLDFFARIRKDHYQFESPKDLINLLLTMARHKLWNHARHARVRRLEPQSQLDTSSLEGVTDDEETPSTAAMGNELLEKVMRMLSTEEKRLAAYRREGLDWNEIAKRTGEHPDAVRKRLMRAIDRVFIALKLTPGLS